jgi:hypothetical protein
LDFKRQWETLPRAVEVHSGLLLTLTEIIEAGLNSKAFRGLSQKTVYP